MSLSIDLTNRPEDLDGRLELFVGFSLDTGGYQPLFAEFPPTSFPNGVRDVELAIYGPNNTVLKLPDTSNSWRCKETWYLQVLYN